MSAKNNVNKDHYTQAGRDRANENIVHDDHKQAMRQTRKRIGTGEDAAPKGEQPAVQPARQIFPPKDERVSEAAQAALKPDEGDQPEE